MLNFRTDILPLKDQLYRLALRITLNTAEAEDIVQETLIKVWNKRDSWDQIDNIEAFCFTVCRNHNQNKTLDDKGSDQIDTSNDPFRQTIVNDQMDMVRQIVDSLPEKQRSCIQLRDFEGKTYKDIALILGITEEQVKVNIFRARQAIKQRYEKLDSFDRSF